MQTNNIPENTINNYQIIFNNILQKINHKPLIISHIFSYMRNEPHKFINIIEKDKKLKDSLNLIFSSVKKNFNDLNHELIENIELIKYCSYIKSKIKEYLNFV